MKIRVKKNNKSHLVKGAHCGCCGKSLPNATVNSDWRWSICESCSVVE